MTRRNSGRLRQPIADHSNLPAVISANHTSSTMSSSAISVESTSTTPAVAQATPSEMAPSPQGTTQLNHRVHPFSSQARAQTQGQAQAQSRAKCSIIETANDGLSLEEIDRRSRVVTGDRIFEWFLRHYDAVNTDSEDDDDDISHFTPPVTHPHPQPQPQPDHHPNPPPKLNDQPQHQQPPQQPNGTAEPIATTDVNQQVTSPANSRPFQLQPSLGHRSVPLETRRSAVRGVRDPTLFHIPCRFSDTGEEHVLTFTKIPHDQFDWDFKGHIDKLNLWRGRIHERVGDTLRDLTYYHHDEVAWLELYNILIFTKNERTPVSFPPASTVREVFNEYFQDRILHDRHGHEMKPRPSRRLDSIQVKSHRIKNDMKKRFAERGSAPLPDRGVAPTFEPRITENLLRLYISGRARVKEQQAENDRKPTRAQKTTSEQAEAELFSQLLTVCESDAN